MGGEGRGGCSRKLRAFDFNSILRHYLGQPSTLKALPPTSFNAIPNWSLHTWTRLWTSQNLARRIAANNPFIQN
jgi:hypothetical protein